LGRGKKGEKGGEKERLEIRKGEGERKRKEKEVTGKRREEKEKGTKERTGGERKMERKEEKEKRGRERDEFCAVVIFPRKIPASSCQSATSILQYFYSPITHRMRSPQGLAHHSVFYRPDALPAAQPTASSSSSSSSFYSLIKYKYVLHMTVHELDKQGY